MASASALPGNFEIQRPARALLQSIGDPGMFPCGSWRVVGVCRGRRTALDDTCSGPLCPGNSRFRHPHRHVRPRHCDLAATGCWESPERMVRETTHEGVLYAEHDPRIDSVQGGISVHWLGSLQRTAITVRRRRRDGARSEPFFRVSQGECRAGARARRHRSAGVRCRRHSRGSRARA